MDASINFVGGIAGGTASVVVGQPLDTVKVKMQTFPQMYRNFVHCFAQTLKQDGVVRGLYAGSIPSLAAQVSENAILFTAYSQCQKGIAHLLGKKNTSELTAVENAVAGSSASFFSSLALCPTELIKCKQQAAQEMKAIGELPANHPEGSFAIAAEIIRKDGLRGLFRGLMATFTREIPGYFFFFGGYELCRTLVTPEGKTKEDLGPVATMMCGGMGGVALWLAIFPADVVKSRLQVHDILPAHNTFLRMLIHIARTEGILALYNGLAPTLIRTFPATGALFLAVENTTKILNTVVGIKPGQMETN